MYLQAEQVWAIARACRWIRAGVEDRRERCETHAGRRLKRDALRAILGHVAGTRRTSAPRQPSPGQSPKHASLLHPASRPSTRLPPPPPILPMSSDVLIDLPDAPSPRSTASDDADAVNTESARVYFGPLQSPEKKFASASRAKTPIRRSTRSSSTRTREHSHTGDRIRHPTPNRLNIAERGNSSGDEDILQDGGHPL